MQKISPLIECPICTEVFTDPVMLCSNQHTFDRICALNWIVNNPSCPTCREAVDPDRPLASNWTVIHLMDEYNSSVDPKNRVPLPRVEQLKGPSQNPPPLRDRAQPVDRGPVVPPRQIGIMPQEPLASYLWEWRWNIKGGESDITRGLDLFGLVCGLGGVLTSATFLFSIFFMYPFVCCIDGRLRLTPAEKQSLKSGLHVMGFFGSTTTITILCSVGLKNLNKKIRIAWRRQQGIPYVDSDQ